MSTARRRSREKLAAEAAGDDQAKKIMERRIELSGTIFSHAAAYDSGVMVGGYVAFFALWAGVSNDIDRVARLLVAALMSVSLLLYFGWQVVQMIVRQYHEGQLEGVFRFEDDPARFNEAWDKEKQRYGVAFNRLVSRYWRPMFLGALSTGILGALILAFNAMAAAFGWPQLTGHW